ncbi:hypothetical protein GCM10011506_25660 [Marivirga lumbricoides]|uniref:2-dehydro-3-deoxyphosphooctonate aldolase n=1 Tax=Marivirga lumbricoides TaxID=1046115 RepID=A0ABQ1MHE3_9BACT|nr:hypothetical protein GCM10011506_25660 [Marivirga lumbricoides]
MRYLLKNNYLPLTVLLLIIIGGCKVQSKFDRDYPEYTSDKNTIKAYEMSSDSSMLSIKAIAQDPSYGRTPENPIFVGVTNHHEGGKNRMRYLNSFKLEDGAPIEYERLKSCCPFKTLNSATIGADQKFGLLDVWVVYPEGKKTQADTLYINAYDQGTPMVPSGYKAK